MRQVGISELTVSSLFMTKPEYLCDLFDSYEYPWMLLKVLKDYINHLLGANILAGFTKYSDNVIVGKNCVISDKATIIGPAVIGNDCEIRPGAYIRGSVITGSGCVIGNSTELKNCILLDNAQLPHYNYVGDSIIGNRSHMGAGALCSNLKSDKSLVTIKCAEIIETGMKKLGAILADDVEVGCGSVLNPGTIICSGSRVYPLTSLRGVIPPLHIVKSTEEIIPII